MSKKIALDFDGTMVCHEKGKEYPLFGRPVPGAVETVLELVDVGHKIILWTVRSNGGLTPVLDFMHENKIPIYGIMTDHTKHLGFDSPKVNADLFIDDLALGAPLRWYDRDLDRYPAIDWRLVRMDLVNRGFL